jgi:hypothetical protein
METESKTADGRRRWQHCTEEQARAALDELAQSNLSVAKFAETWRRYQGDLVRGFRSGARRRAIRDPDYRDFYRDIGFDPPFEYIKPYIHPEGIGARWTRPPANSCSRSRATGRSS